MALAALGETVEYDEEPDLDRTRGFLREARIAALRDFLRDFPRIKVSADCAMCRPDS